MDIYQIENLTFRYPGRKENALNNINLTVKRGEFLLICGKSGCGKSTLLRHLKPAFTPYGKAIGKILFEEKELKEIDLQTSAQKIGYVLQKPDTQIVTDKVWHEIAFGLESLGLKNEEIKLRSAEIASFFGIQEWFHKNVNELSGGQKQLLNLASAMVMQPSVLILDEPTSQLDPIASVEFINSLRRINQEFGTTIIISEHQLEEIMPISDRVIVLDNGRIIADTCPENLGQLLYEQHHKMFLSMPSSVRIASAIKSDLDCPLTIRQGREWLMAANEKYRLNKTVFQVSSAPYKKPIIETRDLWFRYDKNDSDTIKGLNLSVPENTIYAIVGGNGAGKSTALSLLCNIMKAQRGSVKIRNKSAGCAEGEGNSIIGMLPQNPESFFVKNTVEKDLLDILGQNKETDSEQIQLLNNITKLCQLEGLLHAHPYDLSGGEQQRAALAKLLLLNPEILLLDEPTKGMENHYKREFAGILKKLIQQGKTIVIVSHDIEFCAQHADKCAMFFDGSITAEADTHAFFAANSFYTTQASRISRNIIDNAVTVEDIVNAFPETQRKTIDIKEKPDPPPSSLSDKELKSVDTKSNFLDIKKNKNENIKRTLFSFLLILCFIPLTIYLGMKYLDNRKYYFISMLIMIETLLPFLIVFEGRKPQAREITVLACICASAVAGRLAFFMVPQFKPVIAVIIIGGVCFGAESGFLIGSVTGFISNFFFGQGPWTPWQMFSFGIIGFLAGVFFKRNPVKKNKKALCVYGFLATLFIYGIIMNTYSMLSFQDYPTWGMFIIHLLQGFPFDFIHAVSTIVFLLLLAEPFIEKLERIKLKYGLME